MKPPIKPRPIHLVCAGCGAPIARGSAGRTGGLGLQLGLQGWSATPCPSCSSRYRAWRRPMNYWALLALYHMRRILLCFWRLIRARSAPAARSRGQFIIAPDGLPILYIGLTKKEMRDAAVGLERKRP